MATLTLRPETVALLLAEADRWDIQVDPACPFDTRAEVWALAAIGGRGPLTLRWHDEVRR